MTSCVWQKLCRAFNYHEINKTCILMPKMNCMATDSPYHPGYLFVHLQLCKLQPAVFSVRPTDLGWHWVTTDDASNINGYIPELPSAAARYFSRILHRGNYLLGWWGLVGSGPRFLAVNPVTRKIAKCTVGEFLVFPDNSSYVWVTNTPGDSLPDLALPLSHLSDRTPLYLVRHWFKTVHGTGRISGFYNHETKSTYFVNSRVASYTRNTDILCGTGI